jgi:hypothetical protein
MKIACRIRMMKALLITVLFSLLSLPGISQALNFQALLDSGKAEFKRQLAEQTSNYTKAFGLFTEAVKRQPDNAEARYFLGYTIDRLNASDGSMMHLSKKQLTLKASEQFERVNALQRTYQGEILLLDPYSKLSSIWGSLAAAYLTQNNPDSAKWAFAEGKKRGGFIEPILEYNRQLLNSCEKNAILVTAGDNITIPAWYLQTIEKFRTDITIVDAGLINAGWYPKYLKNSLHLKMQLSDTEIDTIEYRPWTPKAISIKNPDDSTQVFNWTLKPTYFDQYILKGDRILLDIIQQNLYNRTFYFSGGPDSTYNLFLTDYLIDDGIVSKLILHKNDKTTPTTILSKNLYSYNIDKLDGQEIVKSKDAILALNGFRWTFYGNSYFLYSKGQKAEAKKLLEVMELKFSTRKLPYYTPELQKGVEELKLLIQ